MVDGGLLAGRILFSCRSVLEAAYAKLVSELTRVYALSQIPTTLEPILINFLQLEDRLLNATEESNTVFIPVLSSQSLSLKVPNELYQIYVWMNLRRKQSTLLMTALLLSLKGLKVPVNNSDSAVINRNYEKKTFSFKNTKRELRRRSSESDVLSKIKANCSEEKPDIKSYAEKKPSEIFGGGTMKPKKERGEAQNHTTQY